MLRVIGCITDQHDIRLVCLAAVICIFGCYTAFSLRTRAEAGARSSRHIWLFAAALVAGSSVWATHFVAELAFRPGLPVFYDSGLTVFSAVIAIIMSWLGLGIALRRRRGSSLLGGAAVGIGVVAMHYTGMAALQLPAVAHWDINYVVASIVTCIAFSSLAITAAFRGNHMRDQLQGTVLLVLGIVALHFIGMTAVTFTPDPTIAIPDQAISSEWLAIAIAAIALLIVGLGLVGSVVDHHLAERSAAEAALLRMHVAELENTKRDLTTALNNAAAANKTKSAFLANMSHELRTPLNAIIGFSEVMKLGYFGPINERYRSYSADIFNSGTHLLGLINDILDLAKVEGGHMALHEEVVDPVTIIQASRRLIESQAQKARVQISEVFDDDLPLIRVDDRRTRQIVINLLSNAVKFTPEGGHVRILAFRKNRGISIAVSDSGIGMAPENIPKALEPFGQIDGELSRKYQGTGLGLPLVKNLTELHGGILTIESKVGAGTTVTIELPFKRIVERVVRVAPIRAAS